MKECCRCKVLLPRSDFNKLNKASDGLQYKCVYCTKEISKKHRKTYTPEYKKILMARTRQWNVDNKHKVKLRHKNYILQKTYGISLDKFNEMLDSQNGVCKICLKVNNIEGRDLGVDHCHTTDEIRGLLCNGCNLGLGFFKDDPDILESAKQYLKDSKIESIDSL